MAYEILEGYRGVAYAHPDCELHNPVEELPPTRAVFISDDDLGWED